VHLDVTAPPKPERGTTTVRRVAGSGWVPATLVALLAAALLHRAAGVSVRDIAAFGLYLGGWIALPGLLIWRWIDRRPGRPLVEDLTVGALVGYVLEFPVYLACLAAGVPRLYLLWPVVVAAATLTHSGGRALWRRGGPRMSIAWSWSVAALMGYLVVWFAHNVWAVSPVRASALRSPYIDEPFHLSLAAGLKHFFPPQVPYVADTPLDYHWLSHLHIAAASWVSGVEPIVLLRVVAIPVMFLLVALAAATVAVRLTGAAWTGPALLGALLVGPADFSGWSDGAGEALLSTRLLLSPSAGFVNAALLVGALLCIEILRGVRRPWPAWAFLALIFVAMTGAKSTSLPTLIAGLVAAAVVGSLVQRAVQWSAVGLAALSVGAMGIATAIFFGSGTHGLALGPFALMSAKSRAYPGLLDAAGEMAPPVALVVAVSFMSYATLAAALLALLGRGGWRRPDHVFLVVACAAGFGAAFTFHQSGYSEYYFLYVTMLPLVVGVVLATHDLVRALPARVTLIVGSLALVSAAVVGLAYGALTHQAQDTGNRKPLQIALQLFAAPTIVMLLLCAATATLLVLLLPRLYSPASVHRRALVAPTIVLVFAGMGTVTFLRSIPNLVSDPLPATYVAPAGPLIGKGGITAARWLRDHSGGDDLVATNAHCEQPSPAPCIPRNFWMAGYTERRVLVEGWSYISRSSVGLPAPADEDTVGQAFWDPPLLDLNDAAFTRPSAATLDALRARGVDWLLVDEGFTVDLPALRAQARQVFESGRYAVFRLDAP
jgi:hypothetical protein